MEDWSRVELIALAALFLGLLAAIAAWLVVPEFRGFLRALPRRAKLLARWLVSNWQPLLGLILLFVVAYGAYALMHTYWAVGLILGLLLSILLMARYQRTAMVFSGRGMGDFSTSQTGSGTPTVVCDPHYPDWIRQDGADWVWIKDHPTDQEAQEGQTVWHRVPLRTPSFPWKVRSATLYFVVDDFASVIVNGALVRRREKGGAVIGVDVGSHLHPGENLVEMEIENAPMEGATSDSNPAGITFVIQMHVGLF